MFEAIARHYYQADGAEAVSVFRAFMMNKPQEQGTPLGWVKTMDFILRLMDPPPFDFSFLDFEFAARSIRMSARAGGLTRCRR